MTSRDFSAVRAANGPGSNTGHKGSLAAPLIDFCTLFLPAGSLKKLGLYTYADLLAHLIPTSGKVVMGAILDKPWNFYPQSAVLVDDTGSVAGRVGIGDDGRVCISLTGQGCQHVQSWRHVADVAAALGAHITRLDIAVDDLAGQSISVEHFRQLYEAGEFVTHGRPPLARYVDDMGTGKGCTLYIGQKGYKELCVYEKGKQLGDPSSKHTRCELRLYAKHHVIPLDALTDPGRYFAGAYPLLAAFVVGEAERLQVKDRMVNASAKAMVQFLRTQAGTALRLVMDALGDDSVEFILQHIARPGRPGRFRSVTGDLPAMIRAQLGASHGVRHEQVA